MFDMVAGSETGAIIGAALITPFSDVPEEGPRLRAKDVQDWFS